MATKALKINELRTNHREVARLSFQGFKTTEIAMQTGLALSTVQGILRDPLCKSYIQGLQDKADTNVIDVRKKLISLNDSAVDVIKDIMSKDSNAPASVQLNAAKDVLDRNGYKAPEKHEHLHGHFTSEDLLKLQERAQDVNTDYLNMEEISDVG